MTCANKHVKRHGTSRAAPQSGGLNRKNEDAPLDGGCNNWSYLSKESVGFV